MKAFPQNPLLLMWQYAWRNKKIFALIVLALIVQISSSKLAPYYFSKLAGLFGANVEFSSIKNDFFLFLGLMFLCTILKDVFDFIFEYLTYVKFRPLVYKQLGADLFLYLSKHSVNFFADNMAGALANKVTTLADGVSGFYGALLYYVYYVGGLFFTFILLLTVNVWLAVTFLIALCLSLKLMMKYGKKSIDLRQKMTNARNKVAGNMVDTLQNSFFVRIFNGFSHEESRATKILKEENDITLKSVVMENFVSNAQKLYFSMFYLCFMFFGFYLWREHKIDTSQLILVVLLLRDISQTASYLIMRAVSYSGIFEEMRTNLIPFATPHEITDISNARSLKVKKGKIEFKNVTFNYQGSQPIFKNFSLTIDPKQKIGIVGMSGAGKSTFINLLERFFDIKKGEILIDEQNIALVTQQSLHENISYVAQITNLLEQSIAQNISYGRPRATKKEIITAAKKAYADKFINELPDKYETVFDGEHKLSGGQMQRLSIARAILKDAPILILDEATSALDGKSEQYIQQAIEKTIKDKTVIAIAHRLSTLKNMDRIIVLEHGKIVEDGSPKELLKQKGKFTEFWKLQQLEEKKNG